MYGLFLFLILYQDPASNVNKRGVCIDGFDVVSYHHASGPMKGLTAYTSIYEEVTYYFSGEENKKLFESDPDQYVPAFGGWCAYAMGVDGSKVDIDPKTFKILNGKLYLFYNSRGNNTLQEWNKNEGQLKNQAERHWADLIKSQQ